MRTVASHSTKTGKLVTTFLILGIIALVACLGKPQTPVPTLSPNTPSALQSKAELPSTTTPALPPTVAVPQKEVVKTSGQRGTLPESLTPASALPPTIIGSKKEVVQASDALGLVYSLLEMQLKVGPECPAQLGNGEWVRFQAKVDTLDFQELQSPFKEDLDEYAKLFAEFLQNPPSSEFDCGVMMGELLLAARPILVDFEINETKARDDGQGLQLVNGIREMITGELGLKNQYLIFLGFKPERFQSIDSEAKAFIEYLSIWMVMYFEDERTSVVKRAQGAF